MLERDVAAWDRDVRAATLPRRPDNQTNLPLGALVRQDRMEDPVNQARGSRR